MAIIKIESNKLKVNPCLSFEDTFKTKYMREVYDRKALKYMLVNWEQYEKYCHKFDNDCNDNNYNPKEILEKYLENSKGTDIVRVTYKKSNNSKKFGRWFANAAISIANMPRQIRHTVCKGLWIDLDFVNCHPIIAEHLCVAFDIDCPILHRYNTNREDILNEIMLAEKLPRDEAKKTFLKVLNGNKNAINVKWWNDWIKECDYIAKMISNDVQYKKLRDIVLKHKTYNVNGSTLNLIMCYYENLCLKTLYTLFLEEKIITNNLCCLIFDGLQVEDNKFNRDKLTPEYLADVSKIILEKTGFNLQIIIKPFDEAIKLPDDYDKIPDTILIENGDDKSAAEFFISNYKNLLKKCNGRTFVNKNGIWTDNSKDINDTLVNLLSNLDIRVEMGDKTGVYSRNKTRVKACIEFVLADDSYTDENFLEKLFDSSLYYLAFNNGIWSFKDYKFYTYTQLPDVYFTRKITRDFNINEIQNSRKIIYDKILDPIFPNKEQRDYFLMCLSRAMAGHIEDKRWYVFQGARNCGKGVLCNLIEKTFGSFVGLIKADNFLCSRITSGGDEAKKMSWLIPLEFTRLAIANEIKQDDDNESRLNKVKINGVLIKGFASGGDTQQARQNYKDEINFKLQSTMMILCNNLPEVEPKDTLETLENFICKSKFISADDMKDIEKLKDKNVLFFKAKDENIKNIIKDDLICNAFASIVFDNYKSIRPSMPSIMQDDNIIVKGDAIKSMEIIVTKMFQKTNDKDDIISTDDIITYIEKYSSIIIDAKKLKLTLATLELGKCGRYRFEEETPYFSGTVQKMGYQFIKLRKEAETIIKDKDK